MRWRCKKNLSTLYCVSAFSSYFRTETRDLVKQFTAKRRNEHGCLLVTQFSIILSNLLRIRRLYESSKITKIFCLGDDFYKYFSTEFKKHQISDSKVHRNKPGRLSDAEIITILILFHSKGFRCFKHFYTQYVCKHLTHLFSKTVSYNRFSIQRLLSKTSKETLWRQRIYRQTTVLILFMNGIQLVTKVKNNMKTH